MTRGPIIERSPQERLEEARFNVTQARATYREADQVYKENPTGENLRLSREALRALREAEGTEIWVKNEISNQGR
jgi:hypothetical protein